MISPTFIPSIAAPFSPHSHRPLRTKSHRSTPSAPRTRRATTPTLRLDPGSPINDTSLSDWQALTPRLDHPNGIPSCIPEIDATGNDGSIPTSGDDRRDDDDSSPEELLRKFGREGETLPDEIRSLSPSALAGYLSGTQNSLARFLAKIWPGWRRRVAADPEFPFKVLMEETVGLGLAASGMIAARGKDILSELDFAICDIAVGATLNFILVYLLTPSLGAGTGGMISRLPANLFSVGQFSILERAAGFLYKSALFGVCGFAGSLVGTSLSQGLVGFRKVVLKQESNKELPNVLMNSAAWAGFMFFSSSPRYQTVAGCERVLFSLAPDKIAKLGSGVLRTGNNVLGGANWVWWARAIGLQKKND